MINSEKSLSCLRSYLASELETMLRENYVLPEDVDPTTETVRLAISSKTSAEISALANIVKTLLARGSKHDIRRVLESFLKDHT